MIANSSQPIVDLYPIVMELDEETVGYGGSSGSNHLKLATNNASLYDAVASEASCFAAEISWMLVDEKDKIETEIVTRENELVEEPEEVGSPVRRRRKVMGRFLHHSPPCTPSPRRNRNRSRGPSYRHDCDDELNCQKNNNDDGDDVDGESTASGGVFANLRSMLQMGSNRHHKNNRRIKIIETHSKNPAPEEIPFINVSPVQSPIRVGTKRNRPLRFHDEYVLTQQIVRCRIATLWECVHRPTGRRYCVKAIDKRRFASPADRAMAVREITMHRSIIDQQFSPVSHLPRIHDIFADEEAAEPTQIQHHDECKSSASCCSGSTVSISSYSHSACEDSNNHNHNSNINFWYIVQDFEAGGENLLLYLLGQENSIFNVPEGKGGDDDYGRNEMSNNELHSLETKASRAASNIMQESEVRSLARSLLLAVKELHDRSICHNDMCPENILFLSSATSNHRNNNDCWEALKLCDLGRAFFVDDANDGTFGGIPQHSSIYYTSPEVLSGKPPGLASDMWSVGVILYRCLAGELPFREQSEDNVCRAYCSASMSPSSTKGYTSKMLRQQLKREICGADCEFGRSKRRQTDRQWSRVSRGAKQFVSALLNRAPSIRMTCEEALHHPWLLHMNNGVMTAPSSPPSRSCSMVSSSLPILPSLTSTNHYHHHPKYSTKGVTKTKMSQGDYSHRHHHQEEVAGKLDISSTIPPSAASAGESCQSVPTTLKSFVHNCFGRLKTYQQQPQ